MTTSNGHQHVSAFEGTDLEPDAQSQALLDLMDLADDIEAGRLTDEGHQQARDALAVLRREVERGPSNFRQAVAMAQTDLRGALETLTRAVETATPLRVTTWGSATPEPRQWLIDDKLPAARVGLLTGEGGAGKSRLMLQFAAGVASGGDQGAWISSTSPSAGPMMRLGNAVPPDGAHVVFASWEDEHQEFYRRLHQISGNAAPWVTPERLQKLHIVNLGSGKGGTRVRFGLLPRAATSPPWRNSPPPGSASGAFVSRSTPDCSSSTLLPQPTRPTRTPGGCGASGQSLRLPLGRMGAGQRLRGHAPRTPAQIRRIDLRRLHGLARSRSGLVDPPAGDSRPTKAEDPAPRAWKLEFIKGNYGPRPEPIGLHWDASHGGLRWRVTDADHAAHQGRRTPYPVDS